MLANVVECIKKGEIEFFSHDKKLSTIVHRCDAKRERAWSEINASDDQKYVWRLSDHLSRQAKEAVVVRGASLEYVLAEMQRMYHIAHLVLDIHIGKKQSVKVHVDVDVDKVSAQYNGQRRAALENPFGKKIWMTSWLRDRTVFERDWNIALCDAWGGFIGYPGYEWPRTAKEFEVCCADHATNIMIGTKEQLSRYEAFAKKYAGCSDEINKMFGLFR